MNTENYTNTSGTIQWLTAGLVKGASQVYGYVVDAVSLPSFFIRHLINDIYEGITTKPLADRKVCEAIIESQDQLVASTATLESVNPSNQHTLATTLVDNIKQAAQPLIDAINKNYLHEHGNYSLALWYPIRTRLTSSDVNPSEYMHALKNLATEAAKHNDSPTIQEHAKAFKQQCFELAYDCRHTSQSLGEEVYTKLIQAASQFSKLYPSDDM